MDRWLVTGGAGFIGSHLVDALLARGDRVRILDDLSSGWRDNVPAAAEFLLGDVTDSALVQRAMAGVSGCFHLAAIASVERGLEDWLGTHRTNLTGTVTVLDAARGTQCPVVYASSAAIYGANQDLPLNEQSPAEPLSAYGVDKLSCEFYAKVAAQIHGVPTAGLRFFNVYGPRQNPASPYAGVIARFVRQALCGHPLYINGDGGATRDFIHVHDAVDHLLAAMTRVRTGQASGEVFNVCTGHSTSVLALAAMIRTIAGSNSPIMHQPERAGDIRHSLGDPARAIRLLGVRTRTNLESGLQTMLRPS